MSSASKYNNKHGLTNIDSASGVGNVLKWNCNVQAKTMECISFGYVWSSVSNGQKLIERLENIYNINPFYTFKLTVNYAFRYTYKM